MKVEIGRGFGTPEARAQAFITGALLWSRCSLFVRSARKTNAEVSGRVDETANYRRVVGLGRWTDALVSARVFGSEPD